MLARLILAALALGASPALGAAISNYQAADALNCDYDAVVVGGGPAGLSALSGLARVRRNVLLIDSGAYRNGPTRHLHDLIGLDGLTPAYYRWRAREQLAHYKTAKMTNGTVTKIEPQANNTYFRVTADGKQLTARKVVLATGLRDIIPSTPGVLENWGKGIYWCPWCDGYEHSDQPLGLLSSLAKVPGAVQEVATLYQDVVAFVNGTDTPANRAATEDDFPGWETYLKLNKVKVYNETIVKIERLAEAKAGDASLPTYPEYDLFRVHLEGGETVDRSAFLVSFKNQQASSVGPDMGVQMKWERLGVNANKGFITSISGVYGVGDANSDNSTNIPHALYTGKRAAVSLHITLGEEDTAYQLAGLKQRRDLSERSLGDDDIRDIWERMNGEPDDLLYAGEYKE